MKNMRMTHKELVDQVSANLFKQSGKIESQRSWIAMRNYLEQLDIEQLKLILKEATWSKKEQILLRLDLYLMSLNSGENKDRKMKYYPRPYFLEK